MRFLLSGPGGPRGPYKAAELVAQPGFDRDCLVCPEGKSPSGRRNWRAAGRFRELAELLDARRASRQPEAAPAKGAAASGELRYWLLVDGSPYGPLPPRLLADDPRFSTESLVCREDRSVGSPRNWRSASKVEALRAILAPPAAPAPALSNDLVSAPPRSEPEGRPAPGRRLLWALAASAGLLSAAGLALRRGSAPADATPPARQALAKRAASTARAESAVAGPAGAPATEGSSQRGDYSWLVKSFDLEEVAALFSTMRDNKIWASCFAQRWYQRCRNACKSSPRCRLPEQAPADAAWEACVAWQSPQVCVGACQLQAPCRVPAPVWRSLCETPSTRPAFCAPAWPDTGAPAQ
ncbi:MAG: hypothetical protein HY554_09755 [Elusimicrobia bacterium]|nr:hypothetical protein [Elusimicrobiota bacterium]